MFDILFIPVDDVYGWTSGMSVVRHGRFDVRTCVLNPRDFQPFSMGPALSEAGSVARVVRTVTTAKLQLDDLKWVHDTQRGGGIISSDCRASQVIESERTTLHSTHPPCMRSA